MSDEISLFEQALITRQQHINLLLAAEHLPAAIVAQRKLAEFCLHEGQHQEALTALHQLIGLNPRDKEAYALIKKLLENYKLL